MKTKITKEVTLDLFKKLGFLDDLSELLSEHSFGNGLDTIYICLNSNDPETGSWRDFETGFLIHKKYIKSKKYFEFHYKLNHKLMTEAQTKEEVLSIILEGFKRTYNEIKSLNIKDFDVDRFYSDVIATIEEYAKGNYVPKEKALPDPEQLLKQWRAQEAQRHRVAKMKEIVFWEIIEQSKEESKDFEHQVEILIDKLSQLSEKGIIGFEYTFREMLSKSAHYNVMAALKIIENYVSNDSFLYFRCRLLAEGKDFYFKVIKTPDDLADYFDFDLNGEPMLSVADRAFIKKFGMDTDKELPKDVALDYYNYDEGEEGSGKEWSEEGLPKKYPKLWKRYR